MTELDVFLPELHSDDPKERQLARRDRLKKRHDHASVLLLEEKNKKEAKREKTFLETTIDNSNENLFQIFVGGKEQVTNVRVSGDTREIQRRVDELWARNLRLQKLEEEASLASEKLQVILNKWDDINGVNDPLDLCQELKDQKARCASLIQQKDALTSDLKEELRLADERYVNDRKDMLTDTDILARRINEQVLVMKRSYMIELSQIEEAIKKTRNDNNSKQSAEWSRLYENREEEEVKQVAKCIETLENDEQEIQRIYVTHDIRYHDVKVSLETDVQILEQELERVKAICLVNAEKLDYNYQVLKKREDENVIIKNNQKRTMNKLQDEVTKLRKKKEDIEGEMNLKLAKINKEICHLHSNIIDIERKSDHFSKVNNQQFLDIWKMKINDANILLNKIKSADKVIHEKILGVHWEPSKAAPLRMENLESYKSAQAMIEEIFQQPASAMEAESSKSFQNESATAAERRRLRAILTLVANNSKFLTEEKLDELLQPYTQDEKTLVRLDNVFHALGVRSKEEVALLYKYFERYTTSKVCSDTSQEQQERNESDQSSESPSTFSQNHPLQIQKQHVLKILKEFVLKLYSSKVKEEEETVVLHLAKDRCTVSRVISIDDILRFWKSYQDYFSKENQTIWDELLTGLTKYYQVLQDRNKYAKRAQRLKNQNQELMSLVEKYVHHS